MECPICYNVIENSAIGSCTHHFCLKCLVNWCKMGGENCPICKSMIYTIRQDLEFDKINNQSNSEIDLIFPSLNINFFKYGEAGITLQNNFSLKTFGKRLPGVKVIKISKDKICYKSGLRLGDIILFINKIPCINHRQTIKIFNDAILNNSTVNLVVDRLIT